MPFGTVRIALAVLAVGTMLTPALADDTGFAYSHDLRREAGRMCMSDHYHYGSGSGSTKKSASRDAIGSWSSFTSFEYGTDWARWGRARSKGISCVRSGKGYDCQVQARPCR